jgi:polyferredoxin
MKASRSRVLMLLAGAALVAGLPVIGTLARRQSGARCEFDGQAIDPVYRVRIVDAAGTSHRFCCIRCADDWLRRRNDPPAAVFVTDEMSGVEVEAGSAVFVHSSVVTNAVTGNRIHAFRDVAAADAHARAYAGWMLEGAERPLR